MPRILAEMGVVSSWLNTLAIAQSLFHLLADCNEHIVMILANQPPKLLLNEIILKAVTFAEDGLDVTGARLPNGKLSRNEIFSNKPD